MTLRQSHAPLRAAAAGPASVAAQQQPIRPARGSCRRAGPRAAARRTEVAVDDAPSTSYAPAAAHAPASGALGSLAAAERLRARAAAPHTRSLLHSSLELEPTLKPFWYPVYFSKKLAAGALVPFELFEEQWVLFRDEAGRPACVQDECAHRACPLSVGAVVDGRVQCAYHGWEFERDGACTKMPSTVQCRGVSVQSLRCVEADGFVWVWPGGEGGPEPPPLPACGAPPRGYQVHSELIIEVPVDHGLLMENLLDLAHAPFTHTTTFARGWPVPDVVKFHAARLLSGQWDPYPIAMEFAPPVMVLSTVGLVQPGRIVRGATAEQCERHLHQMHVCLPSRPGHTRLMYRMCLDFMPWARHIPGIERLWAAVADQVLSEDLVLVRGQQDRLSRGGDTWRTPVSYDKLAVRYRRWRNQLAAGETAAASEMAAKMSAGQMFSLDSIDSELMADCNVDFNRA